MERISAEINQGIFLIKDVAKLLDLKPQKVRYWLNEFWNSNFGKNIGGYSFGDEGATAINFFTFIEFITFAKLREQNISAQKIQKFHNILSTTLNTPYPFAKTRLLNDSKNVWFQHAGEIVKLDGKKQISLEKILGPFLNKIEFNDDMVALRYYPLGKDRNIVIDPKHQFGKAVVRGTNIKAEVIYRLYEGEESKESICDLYNLSIHQVNDAIKYYTDIAA